MSKRGRIVICSRCGHERRHVGHGLCQSCYGMEYRKARAKPVLCSGCGIEQPHYAKGMCHSCYMKAWDQAHLDQHAAKERERRATLTARYREHDRARAQTAKRRTWRRAYHQKWYAAHREGQLAYQRSYRRADPERRNNYKRRRMARVLGLPDTLTVEQWHAILEAYSHACAYCGITGVAFHREHKVPASKGGGYTAENIVPACPTCNLRKKEMTEEEFREYLRLYPR